MKIAVSSCLLGENCKYNGGNNKNEFLVKYLKNHKIIPICPEVMGGLSIPRTPAEIVNGIVTDRDGNVVDYQFRLGAEIAYNKIIKEEVELVILQSRSPSCGVKEVYDGTFSKKLVKGKGVLAKKLEDLNLKVVDIEDFDKLFTKIPD